MCSQFSNNYRQYACGRCVEDVEFVVMMMVNMMKVMLLVVVLVDTELLVTLELTPTMGTST
jgi:hypothetical protein